MAGIQSRLTEKQKQAFLALFGAKSLNLLYKGSIHGYNVGIFHNICNTQGPTFVVGYNASGFIFGGFTSQSYRSSGTHLCDDKAFLFSMKGSGGKPLKFPIKISSKAVLDHNSYGPYFGDGDLVFLPGNSPVVTTNSSAGTYKFFAEDLHGNDLKLVECEVYRPEDVGSIMENPWRETKWTAGEREELVKQVLSFKPYLNTLPHFRVLFLGPIGAGKSSFFNSVNSVFRGYVTSQALTGRDSTSLTKQYKTYKIRNGEGKQLPIVFCDTMGLEDKRGSGLHVDDVDKLLQGHVPDKYQFNPSAAIAPNVLGYIKNPSLKDQIHCVAFIIDGSTVEILPENLEEKLKQIRQIANNLGVPQLVILTKVDQLCSTLEEDLSAVYKVMAVRKQMELIEEKLGIPLCHIVPVKNYSSELELKTNVDILTLIAVRQLLRLAEGFLDNVDIVSSDKGAEED
uniref:TLDc domain-containing protein n=1 Tax=Salvator merianae TaxID=96440 RepID=A0A8D0KLZ3_SALMN